MMITKKAEYAVSAMVDMASLEEGKSTTSKAISERQNIPGTLIVQILSLLRKAGWVQSERGASGGVYLIADPSQITVREVIELFDGPFMITRCLLQDTPCQNKEECPLRNIWIEAQEKMLEVLEKATVKDLTEAHHHPYPFPNNRL